MSPEEMQLVQRVCYAAVRGAVAGIVGKSAMPESLVSAAENQYVEAGYSATTTRLDVPALGPAPELYPTHDPAAVLARSAGITYEDAQDMLHLAQHVRYYEPRSPFPVQYVLAAVILFVVLAALWQLKNMFTAA